MKDCSKGKDDFDSTFGPINFPVSCEESSREVGGDSKAIDRRKRFTFTIKFCPPVRCGVYDTSSDSSARLLKVVGIMRTYCHLAIIIGVNKY